MKKEFTKADLKDGMFVVYRNGDIRVKTGDFLIGCDGYRHIQKYNDNLLYDYYSSPSIIDIVKVGKLKYGVALEDIKEECLDIIWERK